MADELKKQLGKKIREAREENSLTQKELGKALGYSPMAISHFEKGIRELKLSDIQHLAKILKKDLFYFFPSRATFFRSQASNYTEIKKSIKDFENFLNKQKNE